MEVRARHEKCLPNHVANLTFFRGSVSTHPLHGGFKGPVCVRCLLHVDFTGRELEPSGRIRGASQSGDLRLLRSRRGCGSASPVPWAPVSPITSLGWLCLGDSPSRTDNHFLTPEPVLRHR